MRKEKRSEDKTSEHCHRPKHRSSLYKDHYFIWQMSFVSSRWVPSQYVKQAATDICHIKYWPHINKRKFTFPTLSVSEADFRDVLTNPTCNFLFLLIVFFLDIRVPRSVVIRVRGVFRHLVRIIQHLEAGQRAEPPHAARRRQRPVWRFLVQTVIVVIFVCIVFIAAVLEERGESAASAGPEL